MEKESSFKDAAQHYEQVDLNLNKIHLTKIQKSNLTDLNFTFRLGSLAIRVILPLATN